MPDSAQAHGPTRRGAVTPLLQIDRLSHITLIVSDLARANSFYGGFLGLPPIQRPHADVQVAYYRCGDAEVHLLVAEEHPRPTRRHIAFEVSDFDRVLKSIDGEWVRIVGGPGTRRSDGGRFVFVQDPDGNLIEITCPPAPDP